jgi:hypothetical protein
MAGGKQAARNIDERLTGERRWEKLFPDIEFSQIPPAEPVPSRRHTAKVVSAALRVHSQQEVVAALDADEALDECGRCLRCDLKAVVAAH